MNIDETLDPCLYSAVTLAKQEQIQSVKKLRARLLDKGFGPEQIDKALQEWKRYARFAIRAK